MANFKKLNTQTYGSVNKNFAQNKTQHTINRNLMEVLLITNNQPYLSEPYTQDTIGLNVFAVNNVEEAIEKMLTIPFEIIIYDTSLDISNTQHLLAVAQNIRPKTFKIAQKLSNTSATIAQIKNIARHIIEQEKPCLNIIDNAIERYLKQKEKQA